MRPRYDLWTELRRLVNWACENWQRTDEGIWESRLRRQHFVYSKVMSWVAVDRGLRRANKRSFPADRDWWLKTRDQIYEEAANLIMPLVFFVSPTDPQSPQDPAADLPVTRKGWSCLQ
jgi:GH15 family glucan-1,4-alpha-glucosidase